MEFQIAGDKALVVRFGTEISEEVNKEVRKLRNFIDKEVISGITEVVPTYCTLYVFYDPLIVDIEDLQKHIRELYERAKNTDISEENSKTVEVPVKYGGEEGPDLENVAKIHNMTPEEVIAKHTKPSYRVYMLGFTPGFTFLGGLPEELITERHKDPRMKVPAGSVGIARNQTGLYAVPSPGGWQLIGRTYMRFYDPEKTPPTPVQVGDYIKFKSITKKEWEQHKHEIEAVEKPFDDSAWSPQGSPSMEVLQPGMLTTVQDLGRYGYQEMGITAAGAMDEISFRLANRLVGNDDNAPGLEITLMGPKLKILSEALIAITGAQFPVKLNGKSAPMYKSFIVEEGDILEFGSTSTNMRAYLSINGGFEVPKVLGSASTGLNAKVGGFKGRQLMKNDVLNFSNTKILESFVGFSVDPKEFLFGWEPNNFRVVLGPDEDHFGEKGIQTFLSSEYELTDKCDRMACRLSGPTVEHNEKGPGIVSDGIAFGTVQIPGEGYPIVMLKDRQAIGGYTKIATLCTVDAFRFSQMRPGDKVTFSAVSLSEAQKLLWRMEYSLSKVGLNKRYLEETGAQKGSVYRVCLGKKFVDVFVEEEE